MPHGEGEGGGRRLDVQDVWEWGLRNEEVGGEEWEGGQWGWELFWAGRTHRRLRIISRAARGTTKCKSMII